MQKYGAIMSYKQNFSTLLSETTVQVPLKRRLSKICTGHKLENGHQIQGQKCMQIAGTIYLTFFNKIVTTENMLG